ncbi:MAG: hypothetical protein BGP24_06950 [Lysobacterales bacterium 69-70]|nr:hypothetical protein [Xanthomonadaceae bacterium]ODU32855.1 MAG: hypothetical protein ABS97_14175 [Xanthomonadaceae bacterium SCN 69-320]ODV21171.1 MAG: hypothetical protein ABT27_05035 [Xanthomonadaceae bacterium SCN 69-25]OJZ00477.1 MAG: hypothetical protein BGP24_06950 [Xanthomonadales bacterium 69-70]
MPARRIATGPNTCRRGTRRCGHLHGHSLESQAIRPGLDRSGIRHRLARKQPTVQDILFAIGGSIPPKIARGLLAITAISVIAILAAVGQAGACQRAFPAWQRQLTAWAILTRHQSVPRCTAASKTPETAPEIA